MALPGVALPDVALPGGPPAREFDGVIERDEDGLYVASVPGLPGCHTQGASLDELMARVEEAAALCLDVAHVVAQVEEAPLTFVGGQRIRIAA